MSFPAWFHALDLHLLDLINRTWSRPLARSGHGARQRLRLLPLPARRRGDPHPSSSAVSEAGNSSSSWPPASSSATASLIGTSRSASTARAPTRPSRICAWSPCAGSRNRSPQAHVARGRSFTSGHACNNVALAMVGCAIFGRWAWWLWPWAALVSYSRIYVGSHYPSDIAGSWLVALYYSYFILKTAEWLWQKYAPGKFPRLHAAHPRLFPRWSNLLPRQ